ncbi:lgrC, partial [Symbiodinium sp. CCMP2456]
MLNAIGQLAGTALLCRWLPKVKPPCTYSLLSLRAQIAALKMSMFKQASEMMHDASIVPAFTRLCGATVGHGCAMSRQALTLPETLVVGNRCFFATDNILTSVEVDRGEFKVPCVTYMSLPEGSFCGVSTWLPERPTEPHYCYFGNPAIKFKRLSSQAAGKTNQGPEPASCLARFWHHFSSSVLDVFLYRGVQGMVTGAAFVVSRTSVPEITSVWQAYYSTTVTRWFTALTGQKRVFKLPFQAAGSRWQAPILRLLGAKIGQRCAPRMEMSWPPLTVFIHLYGRLRNEFVLWDASFTEIGDDVTVDYDAGV